MTERKTPSPLVDPETVDRVSMVCETVGLVYSGMGPDARILLLKARKAAQAYRMRFGEYPSCAAVVRDVARVMQEYTQSGGVRPFGVSLLVVGADPQHGPSLYQVDPSGAYWAWQATAIGKGMVPARGFLEKRYGAAAGGERGEEQEQQQLFELQDAVHLALLTLKESFEGQMTPENVQIGIVDGSGKFRVAASSEVADYLQNL